jgi:lipopolysaccharide transport system permease protein
LRASAARRAGPFPFGPQTRSLVWELSKREVAGRYRGMNLGVLWSLLQPFLMLAVYTLAFGEILGARWPGAADTGDFALILFVGIIVHAFLAECMAKAPMLVVGNPSYVKRVVFPLDVLPWPVVMSAMFHLAANAMVLLIALLAMGHSIGPKVLLLPIIVLPLGVFALGIIWLLSAFAVYFRDVNQMIGPLVTAMFFVSTAIVPLDAVPERFKLLFVLNPISPVVDAARAVVLHDSQPDWASLAILTAVSVTTMLFGYLVFARLRKGFANVL